MYKLLTILLFSYGFAITTADIYDNSYALIIGINEYEHIDKLTYAVNDAESIQEMLMTLFDFPEENITILKNEEANKDAILTSFSNITEKAKENDRVLVFFAGHGETYKLPNDAGDMGYLMPVDGNLDNLSLSGISMQSVYDIIDKSAAKHILLLFDAAFFGFPSNREYEGVIDPSTPDYIQNIKEAKVRQIITAGGKDDAVMEKAQWGHSAFTSNLFRGLGENLADSNKDGFITGYELGLYIKNTTLEWTDNYQMSKNIRMSSDKGEFIFINNNYGKKDENLYSINRDDIYDDSWAVIIGIDKYQNATNLDYAVEDAQAVKELLISKFDFPEDNVKMLVNQDANKMNINKVVSDISLSAGENDRVLVFFAGHGETMDLPDGGEMGFLFPVDGNQDNLYASAIPMNDLKDWSNISNAKHMLFLVDACYGGLASVGSRSLDSKTTPNYIEKITKNKSRQIITAGGRDEKVIERPEWGHSAFTLNLKRGLGDGNADMNSDGYITANELGLFLSESVTIDSENQQTPQSRKLTSQEGEFVFVYAENTAVIKDKSTNAKLDYLISEMEELKSQSTADKTKPDLKVNSDKQQFDKVLDNTWDSDYPLVFRFIYIDKSVFLGATKHYDGMHLLGLIYGYIIWEKKDDIAEIDHPTYGDYVKHYMHFIGPVAGRRLFVPSDSWLGIDPIALFSMGIMFKRVENQDLGISEVTNDFYYSLTLYNRFRVTKTIGFSLGITIGNEYFHNFDGDNKLYVVYERVDLSPLLTIDITNPFSKKKD